LQALGAGAVTEPFWNAVRANLTKLKDIELWWRVAHGPVTPAITESAFVAGAAEFLPPAPWNEGTWSKWTETVKSKTGRKGKDLFMPLRLALTGMEEGPELKVLLPIIGPERAKARLAGKVA
jgi:glutamyl-tRNA synthetase